MKKSFGRYVKEQRSKQGNPVYFEIRLLDGKVEKISRNCLRSFMAAHKRNVHSYVRD